MSKEHTYQHYIPQLYLKRFAHFKSNKKREKQYFIHCFDKYSGKNYDNNIDKVCGINHFYRIKDETCAISDNEQLSPLIIEQDYLDRVIERNYEKLLIDLHLMAEKCQKENIDCFPNDDIFRFQIAWYITIQYLRLPSVRNLVCNATTTLYPQLMEVLKRLVANIENDSKYNDLNIEIKYDYALMHAQSSFANNESIKFFSTSLSKNYWTFMYSPTGEFMTNDNPILLRQHEKDARPMCLGLTQYGSELYFVFSPFLAVQIYDRHFFNLEHSQDFLFGEVTNEGVQRINLLNYCTAQRHIFSYNGDFSFVEQLYHIEHT